MSKNAVDFFVGIRFGIHFPREMKEKMMAAMKSLPEPYKNIGAKDQNGKIVRTVVARAGAGNTFICYDNNCGKRSTILSIYPGKLSTEGESCSRGMPFCDFSPKTLLDQEDSEEAKEIKMVYEMILVALRSAGVSAEDVRVGWSAISYDNSVY